MNKILKKGVPIPLITSFFIIIFTRLAFAADGKINFPDISLNISNGGGLSAAVKVVILLTIITFLPAALLMMTSFMRFIIVLSLLRHAVGLQQTPPNQVLIGLALFMTFFVMSPVFNQAYRDGISPYLSGTISEGEAVTRAIKPFRKFMFKETRAKELSLFLDMADVKNSEDRSDIPTTVLVPAFVTSELKTAFQIGFVIFIPFLIIDMVVASILMSLGMLMLPPILISLPFKLMLFVLVDGWSLLMGSLVKSF